MSEQQNGDWYCRQCGYLSSSRVTFSETCDSCHQPVEFHTVAEMSEIESLRQQLAESIGETAKWHDRYMRDVEGLNNEGDPIGGDPPCGMRHRIASLEWQLDAKDICLRSVAGALERAGLTECDDPGEAIDVLLAEAKSSFKNFHRSLCVRFGYGHDEQYWWRDLISLEEWIAAQLAEARAEPKCNCDMRTKLVGDGCSVCNPERWAELLKEAEPSPDTEQPERTGVGQWCAPGPAAAQRRAWLLRFEDNDRGDAVLYDEQEARGMFANAEAHGWNCHLFAHAPRSTDTEQQRRDALREAVEYLDSNKLNSIGAGSILHRNMRAAIEAEGK